MNAFYKLDTEFLDRKILNALDYLATIYRNVTLLVQSPISGYRVFSDSEQRSLIEDSIRSHPNIKVAYIDNFNAYADTLKNAAEVDFDGYAKAHESELEAITRFENLIFYQNEEPMTERRIKYITDSHTLSSHTYPLNVKQKLEEKLNNQYIIGFTGEPGSGKTFISKALVKIAFQAGIYAKDIHFDDVAKMIYSDLDDDKSKEIRLNLADAFGKKILNLDSTINTSELRHIVFSDKDQLQKLNSIVHPQMSRKVIQEIANNPGLYVLDAALLHESKQNWNYLSNNNTVLVGIDHETQYRNLGIERNISTDIIKHMIMNQFSHDEKKVAAESSIKVENSGHLWMLDNSRNGCSAQKISDLFVEISQHLGFYDKLKLK